MPCCGTLWWHLSQSRALAPWSSDNQQLENPIPVARDPLFLHNITAPSTLHFSGYDRIPVSVLTCTDPHKSIASARLLSFNRIELRSDA
ncbi:uncharacterized protein BO97DRAFT_274525 [Aspergillus homomorphus CBS 101889]|uniref:Uncharacterized protein n=1 Tax=Aspergillus homomorphus (strain CBS 101889) TaxID=1450537 RepID=A0A395I370_ASPHC|nr:hypothetical protein BO97DRAFT_274525 [Aspergillus homomorphus CBS 101889]RAL14642.1 hypothetical protein BO97DRAFT_274525 [Aspergillus homomorphus CBS 101889]